MHKLTESMKQIIRNYSAGAVATVNADGSPSVSPKATFVIVDDSCIAYGNIRSPGSSANLLERPRVEVSFTDILARMAVRIGGSAQVVKKESELGRKLMPCFKEHWSAYVDVMQDFICISIDEAELISSPAYDVGLKRDELVKTNLEKLSRLV